MFDFFKRRLNTNQKFKNLRINASFNLRTSESDPLSFTGEIPEGVQEKLKSPDEKYIYKIDETFQGISDNNANSYEALIEHLVSCLIYSMGCDCSVFYELGDASKDSFLKESILAVSSDLRDINISKSKNFLLSNNELERFEFKSFLDMRDGFLIKSNISEEEYLLKLSSIKHFGDILDEIVSLYVFYNFDKKTVEKYILLMFYLDAFVLNSDRHINNFGIIKISKGKYKLSPFFDFGRALKARSFYNMSYIDNWNSLSAGVYLRPFNIHSSKIRDILKPEVNLTLNIEKFISLIDRRSIGTFPFDAICHCIYEMLDKQKDKTSFVKLLGDLSKKTKVHFEFLQVLHSHNI